MSATSTLSSPTHTAVMRWRRAFLGRTEHARSAREFVRFLLADTPVDGDAVQVAAELTANATQHSRSGLPGGLYVIEVCRWRGGAALAVADQGDRPGAPPPRIEISHADPPREHGHGLRIVDQLTESWGVRGGPAGRTVISIFTW